MPICPLCSLHVDGDLVPAKPEVAKIIKADEVCSACVGVLTRAVRSVLTQKAAELRGENPE